MSESGVPRRIGADIISATNFGSLGVEKDSSTCVPDGNLSFSSLFSLQGYIIVRSALEAEAIDLFINEIQHGLSFDLDPSVSETPMSLQDTSTFPRGNKRRVFEVAPRSTVSEKLALYLRRETGPLAEALDALFSGRNSWTIPLNGDNETEQSPSSSTPRYWYCPIALPEFLPDKVTPVTTKVTAIESALDVECPGPRKALLCHVLDEDFQSSLSTGSSLHQFSWQPINRRRFLSKGYHVDVGPGFKNDGLRTVRGDIRQGIVMLILLSDCAPGEGGTALIPGSHDWSLKRLMKKSMTHEELNTELVRDMRTATEDGRVFLTCSDHTCQKCISFFENTYNADVNEGGRIRVNQISGKRGDVVLVHSLLLHSGTTNLSTNARLLANGMARFKDFGDKCEILQRDLSRLELQGRCYFRS